MIEIRSLTKRFEDTVAVNNLTLDIHPGVNGLVGHNGAGKSTLFRLISDVLKIDGGSILIDGIPCQERRRKSSSSAISRTPQKVLITAECMNSIVASSRLISRNTPD